MEDETIEEELDDLAKLDDSDSELEHEESMEDETIEEELDELSMIDENETLEVVNESECLEMQNLEQLKEAAKELIADKTLDDVLEKVDDGEFVDDAPVYDLYFLPELESLGYTHTRVEYLSLDRKPKKQVKMMVTKYIKYVDNATLFAKILSKPVLSYNDANKICELAEYLSDNIKDYNAVAKSWCMALERV